MKVSHDFPGGSLGEILECQPGRLVARTRAFQDKAGKNDQRYWFYFRLEEVSHSGMEVQLQGLLGKYRGEEHDAFGSHCAPVFSTDRGVSWSRVDEVIWERNPGRLTFRIPAGVRDCLIAYAHPYPEWKRSEMVQAACRLPGCSVETAGFSREGIPIHAIDLPGDHSGRRVLVIVTALVHSGEDCGAWLLEGLFRELVARREISSPARWVLIPCMNPDGHARGIPRLTAAGHDANAHWWNDEKVPDDLSEIRSTKQFLEGLFQGHEAVKVLLDVHSWSQFFPGHGIHSLDDKLSSRLASHLGNAETGSWSTHHFNRPGTLARWAIEQPGVSAATLELSQSLNGPNGRWLQIDDYLQLGARLGVGEWMSGLT